MAKNYNTRIIRLNYSYTLQEISNLYGNHIRTIRQWVKEGLPIIEGLYPYLVKGRELKKFLESKKQSRKIKLEAGQFYCTRCKQARNSLNNQIKIVYSGKTIGKGIKDFLLQGFCEVCDSKLNRFSNENKLDEVRKIFTITEVIEA